MANITRWNPMREIAAMQNLMDRMFEDTVRGINTSGGLGGSALALDVHEDEKSYTVTTALPGVDAEGVKINLHEDVLTIEAELPERKIEREGTRTLIQERSYGRFSRTIRLPHTINAEGVEAHYEDGILTLTLPKAENALPRAIPVKRLGANNS
ncbi:MAG: Hsp20/alpha crystallin family protein [Anaerolineae bacterium]|jgi:HSP20 family protein|nr:Hsp20/alpha crystallin family protein [Anaerolineae bacterium]